MNAWLTLAFRRDVKKRAATIAIIVGTLIAVINYYDKLLTGTVATSDIVKIGVTYLVPYTVSTISSVMAMQDKEDR